MEEIRHRTVEVNGIKMHIAEKGEGPVVLFLHGWPELWYSWRHQIRALSSLGYHAVAPDLRGYGDTEAPASISSYTCIDIVGAIVALVDTLGVDQVFLVGRDWGAIMETRWRYKLRNIFTSRKTGPPILPKGEYGTEFNPDTPETLPSWLFEEDLAYYVTKYEKTGLTGGLNYYRNLNRNWELTPSRTRAQVKVPVRYITGELDIVYTTTPIKEYIHSGQFKKDVPNLEDVVILEGVAHFIQQWAAEEFTNNIYNFIKNF